MRYLYIIPCKLNRSRIMHLLKKRGNMQYIILLIILISNTLFAQDNSYLPEGGTCNVYHHTSYYFCYDEKSEDSQWVAYELTAQEVAGTLHRTDDFRPDPIVNSGSATLQDYRGSGYDRGHLAPAGDMEFNSQAMHESFFMSNMAPQTPNFNRGIWKSLEEQVRTWATDYGSLYVITGSLIDTCMARIGSDKVCVPTHFYKILYNKSNNQAIAFLLKNEGSKNDLSTFIVPIKTIESKTGIHFLSNVQYLENPGLWHFGHGHKRHKTHNTNTAEPVTNSNPGMVKKSKSNICHDTSSRNYSRTKHFTEYSNMEDCLASGGRLPKN